MGQTGRRIDNETGRLIGHPELPAASRLHAVFVGGNAVYRRLRAGAFLEPPHGGALLVAIHNGRDRAAAARVVTGQVRCERRFPATSLRIQNDDLVQIVSVWRDEHLGLAITLSTDRYFVTFGVPNPCAGSHNTGNWRYWGRPRYVRSLQVQCTMFVPLSSRYEESVNIAH